MDNNLITYLACICFIFLFGKLLHGILAAFYTYIFINVLPFFNFDL